MDISQRTVIAFQQNRHATWRAIRWWVVVFALAAIGFVASFCMNRDQADYSESASGGMCGAALRKMHVSEAQCRLAHWSFYAMVVSGIVIIVDVNLYYRCPQCNRVPGDDESIDITAKVCPHCGARLA